MDPPACVHAGDARQVYIEENQVVFTSDKKVGDIKIDGDRIESVRMEEKSARMFVNVYYKGVVAVVDRKQQAVVASWDFAQEGKNFGSMALDEADHRLFVHARDPGKVLVIAPIQGN